MRESPAFRRPAWNRPTPPVRDMLCGDLGFGSAVRLPSRSHTWSGKAYQGFWRPRSAEPRTLVANFGDASTGARPFLRDPSMILSPSRHSESPAREKASRLARYVAIRLHWSFRHCFILLLDWKLEFNTRKHGFADTISPMFRDKFRKTKGFYRCVREILPSIHKKRVVLPIRQIV